MILALAVPILRKQLRRACLRVARELLDLVESLF